MLLIVSIAGSVLYSYSTNTFSSSLASSQLQNAQREERAQERFSIISVWWDKANQLNLTILNYGKIDFCADAVYINGTGASISSGRGVTIGTGKLISVKLIPPIPIQGGRTYEIIAVSKRGSRNVVNWNA